MPLKRAHTDSMPRLISVETRFVPNKATRKNTWQVNQRYSARAARNLCFSACRAKIDNEENPLETRGRSQKRGKNVVVAVDSSEDSIAAFKYAISNIYKPGDVVTLLHVLSTYCDSPASGSVFYAYNSWDPEIDQTLRHQVEDFLDQEFVHPAASQGINVNVVLVLEHSRRPAVGRIVCKKAEELQAEPLVLATHRKGYLQGLVVGSVSHYCAKHCKQPVLLVQPDKDT